MVLPETRQAVSRTLVIAAGGFHPNRALKEVRLMSTYEEFMVILGVAGLIISILNWNHKK